MVDGRGELAFPQESRTVVVARQTLVQDSKGDAPALLDVLGFVHVTHATTTEEPLDVIRAECVPWHRASRYSDYVTPAAADRWTYAP
jgi:hypothetical protein